MIFLVIPAFLVWFSGPVREAADGVVEPLDTPADLFNLKIPAAPAGPYYQSNQ